MVSWANMAGPTFVSIFFFPSATLLKYSSAHRTKRIGMETKATFHKRKGRRPSADLAALRKLQFQTEVQQFTASGNSGAVSPRSSNHEEGEATQEALGL